MPFQPRPGKLKDDVCSASAAYLCTVLPELMTLPKSELFDALRLHLRANLAAYEHERHRKRRRYRPSRN